MAKVELKYKQGGGPPSAEIRINGENVTSWLSGIRIEGTVDDLPRVSLDLVAAYPIELELEGAELVELNVLVPPGFELEVIKGEDGARTYRSRKIEAGQDDTD